jgi:hypothetical protein
MTQTANITDVEGRAGYMGGAYDDVIHGREWNGGPGVGSASLPANRLGISTTVADGVCPNDDYDRVPWPYRGSNGSSPWGTTTGIADCAAPEAGRVDLGPEFTGPAVNWLLSLYFRDGTATPATFAPNSYNTDELGWRPSGADAGIWNAAVVYAYHLLTPVLVKADGFGPMRASTLPFGVSPSVFAGTASGNQVPASSGQISRIIELGEQMARQAMESSRWGPYQSTMRWQSGSAPRLGQTGTLEVYVGGCGSAGPNGENVPCADVWGTDAEPTRPTPTSAGVYGTSRPGHRWNTDNGIKLATVPTPTSTNNATITPLVRSGCATIPAGTTCNDGWARFSVTPTRTGSDTISTSIRLPHWEPVMYAAVQGQDVGMGASNSVSVSSSLQYAITPTLTTQAFDADDNDNIVVLGSRITDRAIYTNLVPGQRYTAEVVWHVTNGTTSQGATTMRATKRFTPTATDGSVDVGPVKITDPALVGKKLVAYERIYQGNGTSGTLVVSHESPSAQSQTVTMRTPAVTTEVSDRFIAAGEETTDEVTVTNIAASYAARISATLYGPYRDDEAATCAPSKAVETVTSNITGPGTYTTPPVTVDRDGVRYVWVASLTTTTGTVLATHACDLVSETVWVPQITTEISEQVVVDGMTVTDTGIVSGIADDQDATIRLTFHRVNAGEDAECTDPLTTINYPITGPGSFVSPEWEIPDGTLLAGQKLVAFERLFIGGDEVAADECGARSETAFVPSLVTRVTVDEVAPGSTVADNVTITNVPDGVQLELFVRWYRVAAGADPVCTAEFRTAVTRQSISGSGTFTSPSVLIPDGEQLGSTWTAVASLENADGVVVADHACGLAAETVTVTDTPSSTTSTVPGQPGTTTPGTSPGTSTPGVSTTVPGQPGTSGPSPTTNPFEGVVTGGESDASVLLAVFFLGAGAALVVFVKRRPRHSTR